MNLKEQFEEMVRQHDDTESNLVLAEGETYAYLREMLPIEIFLKNQWLAGTELFWDYTIMVQETNRFRKLPPSMNIHICRHFRYDCSRKHTHDYFQLNYILEGNPVIHYGEESYKASPGDFFLLAPGVPHWIGSFGDDIIMLKVYIKYSSFENTFYRLLGEQNILTSFFKRILNSGNTQNGFICFHTGNHAGIREHMLETYRLFINRVEYMNVIIECRITEMFCTLARLFMDKVHTGQETKESMGIGRILAYLQKQYASATLEGTAVWAGYSKNYLCRLLKNGTGKTFSEILNSVRIHKACEYLIHTDMSAADIAANVGYVCIKHFYRVFRNIMGCTPGQYRAEHR